MNWLALALVPVVLGGSLCARKDPLPDPSVTTATNGMAAAENTATSSIAATTAVAVTEGALTLLVTAGVVGHLEPCGCSADQRGGVARAAAAVAAVRREGRGVVLVDGGDRFFAGALPTDPLVAGQERLQARTMAAVTRAMGYDAVVVADRDAAGLSLLDVSTLPPLLDTGGSPLPGTRPFVLVQTAGRTVGLLAVGAGAAAEKSLIQRAQSARAEGAELLVLLAYRSLEGAKALRGMARAAGVDVVVATRAEVPETHESGALVDDTPPVFAVAARGEALLRVDLSARGAPAAPYVKVAGAAEREESLAAMQARIELLRGQVKQMAPDSDEAKARTAKLLELEERKARLAASPPPEMPSAANAYAYAFVPMTPRLEQEPSVRALVDGFHIDAGKQNLAWLQEHPRACPKAAAGAAEYVGDQTCRGCHEQAYNFWKTTRHAHAYQALAGKGRQHDVACIRCHVVGYEKPGGACSLAATRDRESVQCESCHGPGSQHVEGGGDPSRINRMVPETTCRGCHDAENSPHFNDATYRPRVLGEGHQAKAP